MFLFFRLPHLGFQMGVFGCIPSAFTSSLVLTVLVCFFFVSISGAFSPFLSPSTNSLPLFSHRFAARFLGIGIYFCFLHPTPASGDPHRNPLTLSSQLLRPCARPAQPLLAPRRDGPSASLTQHAASSHHQIPPITTWPSLGSVWASPGRDPCASLNRGCRR